MENTGVDWKAEMDWPAERPNPCDTCAQDCKKPYPPDPPGVVCGLQFENGMRMYVDEEDMPRLMVAGPWVLVGWAKLCPRDWWVARKAAPTLALGDFLMGTPEGMYVKYANENERDCRKANMVLLPLDD